MNADEAPALWVVAGCLFEVSLPRDGDVRWDAPDGIAPVTLLAEGTRDGRRHLRFRAGAAGEVELRVVDRAGDMDRTMVVRIAPEADLA